jgi:hypothetical protein
MKHKNRDKRLFGRRKDFDAGQTNRDEGPAKRWRTGGYHRPGSNNK